MLHVTTYLFFRDFFHDPATSRVIPIKLKYFSYLLLDDGRLPRTRPNEERRTKNEVPTSSSTNYWTVTVTDLLLLIYGSTVTVTDLLLLIYGSTDLLLLLLLLIYGSTVTATVTDLRIYWTKTLFYISLL